VVLVIFIISQTRRRLRHAGYAAGGRSSAPELLGPSTLLVAAFGVMSCTLALMEASVFL